MSIEQAVYNLSEKVKDLKDVITTEEATKTALVIPFISQILGYDVTDPREVIPEYTADIGAKRGEKVDFAIKSGEDFRFLIECKKIGAELDLNHATQLTRYFNVTDTEFAILTNGEVYRFYTQLDAANRMDETPFMTLNLSNIDERILPYLELCTKSNFDAGSITTSAEELKFVSELRALIAEELKSPSTAWVKMLASRITSKRMTSANIEYFTRLTSIAAAQHLRDEVNRRLRSAQDLEDSTQTGVSTPQVTETVELAPAVPDDGVVTTDEERDAYAIIVAICCSEVPVEYITLRDAKSYCAILYKDNNRKPIVRLFFDRKNKFIVVFTPGREEIKHSIDKIADIYQYADELRDRVRALAGGAK